MAEPTVWLTGGRVLGPSGVIGGAIGIRGGRVASIRASAPAGSRRVSMAGGFIAPGLIDLHVWGEPRRIAPSLATGGVTAFLGTIGPCAPEQLVARLQLVEAGAREAVNAGKAENARGAEAVCLGVHLEGPFVNREKAGALPTRWMRPPAAAELRQLNRFRRLIRMITLAPELPGALAAIRWCDRRGVIASLGHTTADAATSQRAVEAGARAVTHLFNAMPVFRHRDPGLAGVALTEPRLASMMIMDSVHVDPLAARVALRARGPEGVVLVTDSIRHEQDGLRAAWSNGVYRTAAGRMAGSRLTLMRAVQNAVEFGKIRPWDAVRMASFNPARLLDDSTRGLLEPGRRADVIVFDARFRVRMAWIGGRRVGRTAASRRQPMRPSKES